MLSDVMIVYANKSVEKHADALKKLIVEKDYHSELVSLSDYKEKVQPALDAYSDFKFIFLGGIPSIQGKPIFRSDDNWEYSRFGCQIGWKENNCFIIADEKALPFSNYGKFLEYCQDMNTKYPDVVVPPKSLLAEGAEAIKNYFGNTSNQSANQAQYGTLVYEFFNGYFDAFVCSDSEAEPTQEDIDVSAELMHTLRSVKISASAILSAKQKALCHMIIHAASLACASIAFLPIPGMDAIPITSTQVAMVVGLGTVFKNKLTKSDARIILKAAAAPLAGRALAKGALIFVPGVGWAINSAIAGVITEILGWTIASDFANRR